MTGANESTEWIIVAIEYATSMDAGDLRLPNEAAFVASNNATHRAQIRLPRKSVSDLRKALGVISVDHADAYHEAAASAA